MLLTPLPRYLVCSTWVQCTSPTLTKSIWIGVLCFLVCQALTRLWTKNLTIGWPHKHRSHFKYVLGSGPLYLPVLIKQVFPDYKWKPFRSRVLGAWNLASWPGRFFPNLRSASSPFLRWCRLSVVMLWWCGLTPGGLESWGLTCFSPTLPRECSASFPFLQWHLNPGANARCRRSKNPGTESDKTETNLAFPPHARKEARPQNNPTQAGT